MELSVSHFFIVCYFYGFTVSENTLFRFLKNERIIMFEVINDKTIFIDLPTPSYSIPPTAAKSLFFLRVFSKTI